MSAVITPQFKKSIIPLVVQNLFPGFNSKKHMENLQRIILTISSRRNDNDAVALKYKGEIHVGFTTQGKFKAHEVMPNDPSAAEIDEWLDSKANYEHNTKKFYNYLSTGLAMCHTMECICQLFPQCVLDAFNVVFANANVTPFVCTEIPTNDVKFLAFQNKNKLIIEKLKRQLLVNMIAPGNPNAENKFWT